MAPGSTTKKVSSNSTTKGPRIRKKTPGKDIKRRTKSGCLTCRQRRIKCDESKPCCLRCQKSRRICDYSARLVFLDPPAQIGRGIGPPSLDPSGLPKPWEVLKDQDSPEAHPTGHFVPFAPYQINTSGTVYDGNPPTSPPRSGTQALSNIRNESGFHTFVNGGEFQPLFSARQDDLRQPQIAYEVPFSRPNGPSSSPTHHADNHQPDPCFPPHLESRIAASKSLESQSPQSTSFLGRDSQDRWPSSWQQNRTYNSSIDVAGPITSTSSILSTDAAPAIPVPTPTSGPVSGHGHSAFQWKRSEPPGSSPFVSPPVVGQILEDGTVEWETKDLYDVSSDEGDDATDSPVPSDDDRHRLDEVVSECGQHAYGMRLLGETGLLQPWTVDNYRPERTANPLRNPWTRLLFEYFVKSTGPGLSVFQSRTTTSTQHHSWPFLHTYRAGLWTDMMPKLAIQDQGLLQAMLAMSTMELAHKHGHYDTYSAKHYIWATRRINRALNERTNRCSTTLLAATLLLAFYEIMTAEHTRWSTHLVGARQLILENDYPKMSRQLLKVTQLQFTRHAQTTANFQNVLGKSQSNHNWSGWSTSSVLNMPLIAQLAGGAPGYAVTGDLGQPTQEARPSQQEIATFMQYQDLFWWYARQDMIHSLISGAGLLLNYDQWFYCPPRAPVGLPDAVYGTADHLMLLMGRIASFAAKDRERKIKTSTRPSVPFYGMAPTFGAAKIPKAYESDTLFGASRAATDVHNGSIVNPLEEWESIRRACDIFRQSLGPEFQPLSEEECVSPTTPFGRARIFKNSEIATLWMTFYEAMLVLLRSHPEMPPAAQVAALVAAAQTETYANEIGRVAAGIGPFKADGQSDASFPCSFAEGICPLFFAGVQFQEAGKRRWIVERLLEISRYHGSKSAAVCASGCETAWEKAAAMKKGPPYTRINFNLRSDDYRITRQDLHQSPETPPKSSDRRLLPFRSELRLHFGFGVLGTAEDLNQMAQAA